MKSIFGFFFSQQLKISVKVIGAALLVGLLLSTVMVKLAWLSLYATIFLFSVNWQKIALAPALNLNWLATLPISRSELAFVRVGLFFSGMILMLSIATAQVIILAITANPFANEIQKVGDSKPTLLNPTSSLVPDIGFVEIFGSNPILMMTFTTIFSGFILLVFCVTSFATQTPAKQPRLSGNPWWHSNLYLRALNWSILLLLPCLVLYLAPLGTNQWVGVANFTLSLLWLTYICGFYTALNARIPKGGVGFWLSILGAVPVLAILIGISATYFVSILTPVFS